MVAAEESSDGHEIVKADSSHIRFASHYAILLYYNMKQLIGDLQRSMNRIVAQIWTAR